MNGKLVRDRIPEIIMREGKTPVVSYLDDEDYFAELKKKLKEEVCEFFESEDVTELADVVEVALALALHLGTSNEDFESERKSKCETRGAFYDRIFWVRNRED